MSGERKRQLHSHGTRAARGPADGVPRMAWHAPGLRSEPVSSQNPLRERGFRLGFVYRCPRAGGVGCDIGFVTVNVDSVLFDYCEGPGQWRTQRFGVLYSKFEYAVQDAIKTHKLKPRSRKRVLG